MNDSREKGEDYAEKIISLPYGHFGDAHFARWEQLFEA
jgi:hypothetical protein